MCSKTNYEKDTYSGSNYEKDMCSSSNYEEDMAETKRWIVKIAASNENTRRAIGFQKRIVERNCPLLKQRNDRRTHVA